MAKAGRSGGRYYVYKKGSAAQFSLSKAYRDEENEHIIIPGVVWMELAKATGQKDSNDNNTYDWDNKVTVALTIADVEKIIYKAPYEEVKLFHDNKHGNTQSVIRFGPGQQEDSFKVSVSRKKDDDQNNQYIYLSDVEFGTLRALFGRALSELVGWTA